jgi:hypothetical protein
MILRTYALYRANLVVLVSLALILVAEIVIMALALNLLGGEFSLAFNNCLSQTTM